MSDKYKNGKIYTIRCKNDDTLIYVGSTIQPLFKRWHEHKRRVNNEKSKKYNYCLYKKMRETNIEDWYIELYEDFSCENKEQLNKREGQIIREIGTLNKKIAGRTKKEYIEDNKDKIKQYYKEYQEKNKEYYKEYKKEYLQNNKEKIKEYIQKYNQKNKQIISERQKEYQEKNKDKIKEYREANKEKIKEYQKEYQKQYRKRKEKNITKNNN